MGKEYGAEVYIKDNDEVVNKVSLLKKADHFEVLMTEKHRGATISTDPAMAVLYGKANEKS